MCEFNSSYFYPFSRRLSRTILFPYTTLFRSVPSDPRQFLDVEHPGAVADVLEREPPCQLDRKSTRLNSSHLVRSYAVFCLKKQISTECEQKTIPFLLPIRSNPSSPPPLWSGY